MYLSAGSRTKWFITGYYFVEGCYQQWWIHRVSTNQCRKQVRPDKDQMTGDCVSYRRNSKHRYGPIEVRGISKWVCGTDTFTTYPVPAFCSDGSDPKQVVVQRIYHKTETPWHIPTAKQEQWHIILLTATNTLIPGVHIHFVLKIQMSPNPLNWSIVEQELNLHSVCLTWAIATLPIIIAEIHWTMCWTLPTFELQPWWRKLWMLNALQGISAGYVDIYSKTLDGMWINIPPDVCNGNYWIVVEIDPNNNFRGNERVE